MNVQYKFCKNEFSSNKYTPKKEFKHWNENKKSKAFLQVLSSSVRIPTSELIKYETGSNEGNVW